MSRRKRYVPKAVLADPISHAMTRAVRLPEDKLAEFVMPMRATLDAARRGQLGMDGWRGLADRVNVGQALARRGIASDRLQQFTGGQVLLAEILDRAEARGTWTLYPHEICALELLVDLHAIQLSLCSQGELADATEDVRRWVREARRGNSTPGARLVNATA